MVRDQFGNETKPDEDEAVSILLASGKEWHPFRPDPDDFTWEDIGAGASRIPRFNGQLTHRFACKAWDSYVLAQHLCLATDLALAVYPRPPVDVLIAVHLHDGEEPLGGMGDPVGPVKHSPTLRTILRAYYAPILDAIADKAMISRALMHGDPAVKKFDKLAYRIENFHLRGIGDGHDLTIPERHRNADGGFYVWPTLEAYDNWMATLSLLFTMREIGEHNG